MPPRLSQHVKLANALGLRDHTPFAVDAAHWQVAKYMTCICVVKVTLCIQGLSTAFCWLISSQLKQAILTLSLWGKTGCDSTARILFWEQAPYVAQVHLGTQCCKAGTHVPDAERRGVR